MFKKFVILNDQGLSRAYERIEELEDTDYLTESEENELSYLYREVDRYVNGYEEEEY